VTGGDEDLALPAEDYERIFHHASDGFFVHPPDSDEILEVNTRLTDLLGYSRSELLSMRITDITADGWEPPVSPAEYIQEAREEGQITFEWLNERKDGTEVWFEVNLTLVTLADGERVLSSVRDISERKRRQRRIRATFDQTFQFIGLLEPDGTLIEANQAALEFGGVDRADVVGLSLWETEWFAYDSEVQAIAKQAVERAADGEFVRRNVEVRGADGTEVIDFSLRPVTDAQDRVTLLVPEGRLITDRLKQRQRLDVYSRVMRHNIRNKLTVVDGLTNELKERLADPELEALADRVLSASARLETIAEQIREFDRLRDEELATERVAVGEVLHQLATEYDPLDTATTVEADCEPGLAIHSNRSLIELALRQLVENAVQHGGTTVRMRAKTPADDRWGVEIVVSDDGDGVPMDELAPIREGTRTQVEHGTGIGLHLSKWSVDELGGRIDFEVAAGTGTTVTVRLPPSV